MIKQRIVVRALVVKNDGKVLVLQRSPGDDINPGRVDLPGGGVEPDDAYETAMVRELKEEVGLRVKANELRLAYTFTRYEEDTGVVVTRQLYVVHVSDSKVRLSHEHTAYLWQAFDKAERLFAETSWCEAMKFVWTHSLLNA